MKAKTKKKAPAKKPIKKQAAKIIKASESGSKLKITNLKLGGKDRKALKEKAKLFTKGNLSAWLRYAGLQYVPKKGEQIPLDPNEAIKRK